MRPFEKKEVRDMFFMPGPVELPEEFVPDNPFSGS